MDQEGSSAQIEGSKKGIWQRQEVWYLLAVLLSSASLTLVATGIATDFALLALLFASLFFGLGLLQSAPEDVQ